MILLYAKNICKRYPTSGGYFYALNKCTLAFSDKGLVAIKGKSGSGKSTLLNLLCGIEKKDEGRILFAARMSPNESILYWAMKPR